MSPFPASFSVMIDGPLGGSMGKPLFPDAFLRFEWVGVRSPHSSRSSAIVFLSWPQFAIFMKQSVGPFLFVSGLFSRSTTKSFYCSNFLSFSYPMYFYSKA